MSKIREEFEQVLNIISQAVDTTLELEFNSSRWRIVRKSNSRPIGPRMKTSEMRVFLNGMAELADLEYTLAIEQNRTIYNTNRT